MSAGPDDPPPAYLDAPTELYLRDVAKINARVALEVAAGTRAIHVVGVHSLSYGSRAALDGLITRMAGIGVHVDIRPR